MTRLPDIQGAFQRFMLAGDTDISEHVVGTERVAVATRLAIYGDGYRLRLIEALQASFPVLADLLGEGDFDTLATRYIHSHESTFFSVRYYGHEMAAFLAQDEQYSRAPILAELAAWEWAMAAAFDAADAGPIDSEALGEIAPQDWAELQFQWSASVQLLTLSWNVPELWKAVTTQTLQPEPLLNEPPAQWLIWRHELQIFFRPVQADEAAAIMASRGGQSFGELCEALCDTHSESEAPRQAAGWLRGWVQSGFITGLSSATG